jgi:hypothetical protein
VIFSKYLKFVLLGKEVLDDMSNTWVTHSVMVESI